MVVGIDEHGHPLAVVPVVGVADVDVGKLLVMIQVVRDPRGSASLSLPPVSCTSTISPGIRSTRA